MKHIYSLILLVILIQPAFAQYTPSTALKVNQGALMTFTGQSAVQGPSYGCLTALSNVCWFYYTICDSVSVNVKINSNYADTMGAVIFGPFQDTANIDSQILTASPLACIPATVLMNPWQFDKKYGRGIYYGLIGCVNQPQYNVSVYLNNSGPNVPTQNFDNRCSYCNSLTILNTKICSINFDLPTQRNKLIWEKGDTSNISGYMIYRENNISGQFDSIGYVPVDSVSEFIDMGANPALHAWRYQFIPVDQCGHNPYNNMQGVLDNSCKCFTTLFLQQAVSGLNSINLDWNSGINLWPNVGTGPWLPSFYIYRGSSPGNMVLIDSVNMQIMNYTDVNPSPGQNYYQIGLLKANACVSSFIPSYASSGSNIIGTLFTGLPDVAPELQFSLTPNPAFEEFSFQLKSFDASLDNVVQIITIDGRTVDRINVTATEQKINVDHLAKGVYIINLENRKGDQRKKLIIR